VQQIFSTAKHKAGIGKAVGIHSLRHSFVTYLLDKGTDIKYIKRFAGALQYKNYGKVSSRKQTKTCKYYKPS
jgi:site-specific recombinase XerD